MIEDARGTSLTTGSARAVAALEEAVTALLAHRADLGTALARALAEDAGLVAGQVLGGFVALVQARAELRPQACAHLAAARAALRHRGGTAREAGLVQALAAWAEDGDMAGAATLLEGLLHADPRDVLALKLAHAIRFMLGDAVAMRRAVEGALPAWRRDMPLYGYVLGCHAFALEETGEAAAAELAGRAAVAVAPDDLWGAHAVAHVMEREGRARQGLAWIAGLQPRLAAGGAFGRHVQWHAALFHLHLGEGAAALELFDGAVLAGGATDVRDFANAASLLWRLQAQGVAAGRARWQALAELAAARIPHPGLAFIDLHEVLALGAAGRGAALAAKLAAMRRRALAEVDTQARLVAAIGLPAAQGIAAALAGDAAQAVERLLPLRATLRAVGGSDAQRDLVERLLLEACLQGGRQDLATRLLEERALARPPGAWEAACAVRLRAGPAPRAAAA